MAKEREFDGKIVVFMKNEDVERLRKRAREIGANLSSLSRMAILEYLSRNPELEEKEK